MSPQSYKVVSTSTHEISGWKILSIFLHWCDPRIGGMNGDVQFYLATLVFNNLKQLEYFHSRILIIQQEIILYIETVSPKRLIFQYMKELSNSDSFKAFIASNMTYIITFINNNGKYSIYTIPR